MERLSLSSRLCAVLIVSAVAPRLALGQGALDLVKRVPADAWGFVVLKSLDDADAKGQLLAERLGLPLQLKAMLNATLPIGESIDSTRPIAVVSLDYAKYEDQGFVLMVPAKDPKALLEALGAGEETEGIRECTVAGEKMQAASQGDLVFVSPGRDLLAKFLKSEDHLGSAFSKARAETLQDSDVFISVSLGKIVGVYQGQITPFVMMAGSALGGGGPNPLESIVSYAQQTESLDVALKVDSNGVSLTFLLSGKKDSDLEKFIVGTENVAEPLVGWLPKEDLVVAMGASKLGDADWLFGLLKLAAAAAANKEATTAITGDCIGLMKQIRRCAVGVSALPEGPGGMLGFALAVETKDAASFVEGVREAYKKAWSHFDDEGMESIKKAIVHAADAETLGGHKVDTIRVDLKALGDETSAAQAMQIEKVLGRNPALRFGAVDSRHVVAAFGGGESRFEAVAKQVASSTNALSGDAGVKASMNGLPGARSFEVLLAIDTFFRSQKRFATVTGSPLDFPFDVPVLNAPVAFSHARQGKISRYDVFVPMKNIDAAMNIKRQMSAGMDDFDKDEDEDSDEDAETENSSSGDEGE